MGLFIVGSWANPNITRPYMGSHPVQLTADTLRSTVEGMGINHRCIDTPEYCHLEWTAAPVAMKGKDP